MKTKLLIPLLFSILIPGCSSLPFGKADNTGSLQTAAIIATSEAVLENPNNRATLEELSVALEVFCGQQQIDSLALLKLVRGKLGGKTGTRLGYLFLLFNDAGVSIKPADYVAWGNLACALRNGIKSGLTLSQ